MLKLLKKLFTSKKPQEEAFDPDGIISEKWEADFSRSEHVRFALIDTASHSGFIENKSLVLALKKPNCLAWIENSQYRYSNIVIRADLRIDAFGGYAAAGISFRMVDEVTNYSLLVSSKGFFRIDVIRNKNPLALLGWTEIPGVYVDGKNVHIEIIASGNHFIFLLNNEWTAEIYDDTLPEGTVGFAAASYEAPEKIDRENPQVAKAYLDFFSVESRELEVEAIYNQWKDGKRNSQSRFRLAETYFAMGKPDDALSQLHLIWDDKTHSQSDEELLLAAKSSLRLSNLNDAEKFLSAISASPETDLYQAANLEKARLLYVSEKYEALKTHTEKLLKNEPDNVTLLTLQGHADWNLKDFSAAAAAYEKASMLDTENGLPAKNAGNAYDILGDEKKAVECYIKAGRCFLNNTNYEDLSSLVPRLLFLAPQNWEVHALAGKLAFGISQWQKAEMEFDKAERLRLQDKKNQPEDPAMVFLRGLILIQKGARQKALSFLKKAIALDDEHSVFHFKLAETRFMLFNNPDDEEMKNHLALALEKNPSDGWTENLAAQIALARGDLSAAENHLANAIDFLSEIPAVKVNKAQLLFQKSLHDEALEILESSRHEDPDGMMASCAGNLLSKLNRHEDAEAYYRKALSIDPDNAQYKMNLASNLIQAGLYIEAEDLLVQVNNRSPSADAFEMIAFIAAQKAEYQYAEEILHAALKLEPQNFSVMISLGWIYANSFRWKETEEVLQKIESLNIEHASDISYIELRKRFEEAAIKIISCSGCKQTWKVSKIEIDVPPIKLFSEPPDELPAGTCPSCGKTFCIGCAKKSIDEDGRFVCKKCGKNLKLTDSGLRKIINNWSAEIVPEKKTWGRPKKTQTNH
jgi:tetratricopeptide (TPR) repeat protein